MFTTWIQKLFGKRNAHSPRARSTRRQAFFRVTLEPLEERAMLAFVAPVSYPVGSNPAGIAVGDFNSDGRDDMAVVNNTLAGSVSVLTSNADGSFQPKVDFAAGQNSFDASSGDLNGDGKLDLVVVGAAVDVLMGNGDGTFAAPIEFAAIPGSHSVKIGDFNNDGKLDVGTMNSGSASVFLGNGDGTLQARMDTAVAGNNINLVIGDYNHDGNLDMATSNTASVGTISVLRGHGDGSFDAPSSYYAFSAPVYLAQGDFNHDGYLDFAVPNSYVATSMSVIMNNGDGTYAPPHTYGIAQTGYEIEVEDFNHDGHDDYAVRGGSQYMVAHGKGDGTFYPPVNFPTPSGRFEAGTHGDFNGDGSIDLAYPSSNGVTVVANDNADNQDLAGAVTFQVVAPATTTSGSVLPMTIRAVDADGNVVPDFRGVVYISSSDPKASTASGYAFNPLDAGIPYVFTAADAGSHSFTGAIRLVTGGDQTVTVSAPNMTSATTTVNVTGQVTNLAFTAPSNVSAGDTFNITVTARDSQGAVAPGYSSTLRFSSTDTLAGLPADYTFTPEDAGQHTFTVTLKSSGARFVGATELGGTIRGGATVNVAALEATSLLLAGSAGAIGVARPVTIVARDTYGNPATSYNGVVHFTSSDPAAILPADVTLVNGKATANVTLLTVGLQTITATDINTPSITGTVSSDATPPIPAKFDVQGYPSTTAGVSNTFTVTVRDTIGQVASGFTGTVYFSSSDLQAGLPASYTFTAADAGSHTFAATLRTAGLQSITARDVFGTLIGSEAGINVSAADFAKFSLSVPNGADSKGHILVAAGDVISLTVNAVDTYGNIISNYAGTVALSSTDSAANLPANYTFTATDAGSHTFAVDLRTATPNGVVWSFDVVDTQDPTTLVTKTNFEVVNAQASVFKLSLPNSSNNIVAGEGFTAKVTALDAYGNTAKNYFGTVQFISSALNADLPFAYTFDNIDSGVHDFFLSLNTSGTQSVTVVDTSDATVVGTESATIIAAAASGVRVNTAATATAGSPSTLTVSMVDSFGNVATDYRGSVSFSSSDQAAGLPATYAFAKNDAGVRTFAVTFKTVGTQSVTVSDIADASIVGTASGIDVTAASQVGSFELSGFPATTAGAAQSFTVRAKDLFGNYMTNYTGTVSFNSSDAKAGLPTSYTFTTADAGVHTFTATLKTAGAQSISVKDAVTSTAIGSQSGINVTAAATAGSISVTGFPATTAGANQSFTVTVRDLYGNICTSYQGTLRFSSSDLKAGLPANYTFTAADAGVHTFTANLKTAGTQSISAVDVSNGAVLGSQTGIVVTAGNATTFRLSAPSSVTQGVGFKVTVTALDAYGNIATGYRGKVNITSNDPKGGKSSYSFSSKDNGVATISYTFSTLGLQTLFITDSANSLITSKITLSVLARR
ncbi:MAG: VCBS repeat-containing protein [Planctomycetaceae bacterium]|nr:VCBS repeat-containing protein [Planctomycetaceae bacterium]